MDTDRTARPCPRHQETDPPRWRLLASLLLTLAVAAGFVAAIVRAFWR